MTDTTSDNNGLIGNVYGVKILPQTQKEWLEYVAAAQTAARKDELRLACEYWEKNPTKPATYMIDRISQLERGE